MRSRLMIFFILLTGAATAHAGAWTQDKGHGLFIGQATYYGTSSYFDTTGEKMPQARFNKYELQPYVEYGALDWLTVGGSIYLQQVHQSGIDNYGIADPELFARLRLYKSERQVVSVQPLLKLRSHFENPDPPKGGSTSTDEELSLLYGRNLDLVSNRDYLDTRLGYRTRNDGRASQWRGDVSLGLSVTDAIQLIPSVRAIYAPFEKDASSFSENGDLDYSVLKLELAGIYHLDQTEWLQATVFSHVAGIQTGDGDGISFAFAKAF